MINNNTQQNTNINTGTISESSIYLKKSELPKDISSFRNDVGYISSSALGTWLKEHSYISKNEINALIKKANLVVVDSVNKNTDEEAIARLNQDIIDIKGEIVAIKDRLVDVESGFISIEKEGSFASKNDVRNLSNKITNLTNEIANLNVDTSNFATKDEIPVKISDLENNVNYALKSDLTNLVSSSTLNKYAKKTDLDSKVSKDWIQSQGYIQSTGLKDYAKKSDLTNLVTTSTLTKYAKIIDIPDVSNYALKSEIPSVEGLATKQELKNYAQKSDLTKFVTSDTLSKYAKKTDLDSKASKDWVQDQGFLKSIDLKDYAKKSDLTKFVTSDTLIKYAKKTDVDSKLVEIFNEITNFASKDWVQQGFVQSGDLTKYALKSDLNKYATNTTLTKYAKKTELNEAISGLASEQEIKQWVLDKGYISEVEGLKDYVKQSDLTDYVKSSTLGKYAKKTEVDDKINTLASKDWIQSQGFVQSNDLNKYAKKSDLTNLVSSSTLTKYVKTTDLDNKLNGLASEQEMKQWVLDQGYISEIQDLDKYAKKSDLTDYVKSSVLNNYAKKSNVYDRNYINTYYLSKSDIVNTYLSKSNASDTYLTKTDARKTYLAIEDYIGFKDATVLMAYDTMDAFEAAKQNGLRDGFYIINGKDVIIMKENNIVSVFENGTPQLSLSWIEV